MTYAGAVPSGGDTGGAGSMLGASGPVRATVGDKGPLCLGGIVLFALLLITAIHFAGVRAGFTVGAKVGKGG